MPSSSRFAALALTAAVAGPARAADLPPDLALVHPDALGFVHVRLADVWKHEAAAVGRRVFAKAGPKPLAALEQRFAPRPSTADRVTAIVVNGPNRQRLFDLLVVMRFTDPVDPPSVRKAFLPKAEPMRAGGKEYFEDPDGLGGLYLPDERTVVYATRDALEDYLLKAPRQDGGLLPALRTAAAGKAVTAAVNVARLPFPKGTEEQIPPEFRGLYKTRLLTTTVDLGKRVRFDLRADYDEPADAADGERALRELVGFGRAAAQRQREQWENELLDLPAGPLPIGRLPEAVGTTGVLGLMALADEVAAGLTVRRAGPAVTAGVDLPEWATEVVGAAPLATAMAVPMVQKVLEAQARTEATLNLKQIALAAQNYHDEVGTLPPAASVDKRGNKLLSWRVHILPYLGGEGKLYQEFKLDEPWNSDHNRRLIRFMPKVYSDPRAPAPNGHTYYKAFVGADTPMRVEKVENGAAVNQSLSLDKITDGTANTVLVAAGGSPVEWTRPDDIPFNPKNRLPDLFRPFRVLLVAVCDGSVRALPPDTDEKTLKSLLTANGGEAVPLP